MTNTVKTVKKGRKRRAVKDAARRVLGARHLRGVDAEDVAEDVAEDADVTADIAEDVSVAEGASSDEVEDLLEGEILPVVEPKREEDDEDVVVVPPASDAEDDAEWTVELPSRGGKLVRQDTLSRYLAEINRYARISAEEEHELALQWREGHDPEAAAALVRANLGLVVAVAMGFRRAIANVLDLIQEGNIGLMEAVDRFDPHAGTRLSTYATWWIRSRIIKYLLDNWRLVRVGTTNDRRKLLYNLRSEKEKLEREGIKPTPKLLASRLGTSTKDVIAVDSALGASDVSLDQPVGEDGDAPRSSFVAQTGGVSPELAAAESEFRERLTNTLTKIAASFSDREHALLYERLLSDEPVTLQQIADREGVTCEAIRQSEKRLLKKLREGLTEHLPEAAGFDFTTEA